MKDLRQLSERGHSNRFTFLNRAGLARWAPIPLRLIVGYDFMQHGFAKLSRGPEAFAAILQALGYPIPKSSKVVSMSMSLPSGRSGVKDVLKFEDVELSPEDIKTVKSLSKRGTLSVIRNYDVAEKVRWGGIKD